MAPSPPLRSWTVEGFKSIASATVEFRPLTVVVGENSSGKSSLLQSVLLAAQAALIGSGGNVLPMHGPLVSVGSFGDAVFAVGKKRRRIVLGGSFHLPGRRRGRAWEYAGAPGSEEGGIADEIAWDVHLAGAPADDPGAARIRQVQLTRTRRTESGNVTALRLRAVAKRRPDASYGILDGELVIGRRMAIHDVLLHSALPTAFLVARRETEVLLEQWLDAAASKPLRRNRPNPSPRRQTLEEEELTELVRDLAAEAVFDLSSLSVERPNITPQEAARHFAERWESRSRAQPRVDVRVLTNLADEIRKRVIGQLGEGEQRWVEPDPRQLAEVVDTASRVRDFLATVNYLGPLREEPKAVYSPAPTVSRGSVGAHGEYVTAQLHAFGDQPVSCPMPEGGIRECSLSEAVALWLDAFEVGESLTTRNLGRPGIELRLHDRYLDKELDLTSVGVGVSQVLPIIVQCLSAHPGSLTLIEQPELHLNPAVQQRLGDFLLECALSGRQLLIETHSDHLVARLRRRIARDPGDEIRTSLALLFAERFGGETTFRVVEPNEFGGIDEWPHGFFDHGASESQEILRAALAKHTL
jgi:predicted ATPase